MSSWKVDGKLPTKPCKICNIEVPVKSRDRWERTKYCSKKCMHQGLKRTSSLYKNSKLLQCNTCGLTLDRSMFGSDSSRSSRGGKSYRCIPCSREYNKKTKLSLESERKKASARFESKYGINLEEYERLFDDQDGLCAICKTPATGFRKNGEPKRLAVDHDHVTGKVRGLLCFDCNTGLGKFGDDAKMLKRALDYLVIVDTPDWI